MSSAATALPWALYSSGDINGENGEQVCWPPNKSNGELIVRAVNSHEALLAACEAVLAAKEYNGDRWVGRMYEAYLLLKAACAQARGET